MAINFHHFTMLSLLWAGIKFCFVLELSKYRKKFQTFTEEDTKDCFMSQNKAHTEHPNMIYWEEQSQPHKE